MTNARFPNATPRSAIVLAALAGALGCSARNVVGDVGGRGPNGGGGAVAGVSGSIGGSAGSVTGAAGASAAGGGPGGSGAVGGGAGKDAGSLAGSDGMGTAGGGSPGSGGGAPSGQAGQGQGQGQAGQTGQGGSVGSAGSAGQPAANGGAVAPPLKAASFVLVPGSAVGSLLADMNGDGKLDLLGLNGVTGHVTLMLGHGDGTFGAISTVGTAVNSFAVGDLDGDKIPELVTTSGISGAAVPPGTLAVYTNKGDATFSAPVDLPVSSPAHSVLVADVNGDGRLDIAAGCELSTLDIFVNKGGGQFAPEVSYIDSGPAPGAPTGSLYALQVAAGDLNGDGATDLAVVIGDFGRLTFLINKGDGTFSSSVTLPTPNFHQILSPTSVVLADMNGDGKADFVAGGGGDNGQIFLTTGADLTAPGLGSVLNGGNILAVVDMNGDGHLDVVLPGSPNGAIYGLFLGGGDGVTGEHVSFGPYTATAVGDVNGDGKPDLVVVGGVLLNTTP